MQFPIFPKLIVCGIVDIWWGAVTTATLGDTGTVPTTVEGPRPLPLVV